MGNCVKGRDKNQKNNNYNSICNDLINDLYDQTWRQRDVQEEYKQFVREVQDKVQLKKNYNLTLQSSTNLSKICNSFREVRGDGNCFYTAFGFQFLLIIIMKYDDKQFNRFLETYKAIKMRINTNLQKFKIEMPDEQTILREEFFQKLKMLRDIKIQQREEEFIKQFQNHSKDTDCCLYGLSTIFFRNLANLAIDKFQMGQLILDRDNLLIWEQECNNNEVVIAALAKILEIKILLVFFQNNDYELKGYEEDKKYQNQVILLIRPGHYNIGLYQEQNKK